MGYHTFACSTCTQVTAIIKTFVHPTTLQELEDAVALPQKTLFQTSIIPFLPAPTSPLSDWIAPLRAALPCRTPCTHLSRQAAALLRVLGSLGSLQHGYAGQ
jgi:hypothetical protein